MILSQRLMFRLTSLMNDEVMPQIRKLEPGDAKGLGNLFQSLIENGDGGWFEPMTLDRAEAIKLCNIQPERDSYYVLINRDSRASLWHDNMILGDKIVGFGMLRGWDIGHGFPFLAIAIHGDFQGKGYGDAFMRFLHRAARYSGATYVRLITWPENHRSIKLYEKHNYRLTGQWNEQNVMEKLL